MSPETLKHHQLEAPAFQYRASDRTFFWTFLLGFLCPLCWIFSYQEHRKMQDVQAKVIAMGIDPGWWREAFR